MPSAGAQFAEVIKDVSVIKDAGSAVLRLAIPSTGSAIASYLPQLITTLYVGQRLPLDQFAAYSATLTTMNMFAMSVVQGLTGALATLSSQAYGRDPESGEMGELAQRAILVNLSFFTFMAFFFFNSEPLLMVLFGSHLAPQIAHGLIHTLPYLLVVCFNLPMRRTLNCSRQTHLPLLGNMANAFTVLVLGNFYIQDSMSQAFHTMAVGSLAAFTVFALLWKNHPKMVCVRNAKWPVHDGLFEWSGTKDYLQIALASVAARCAEQYAFEGQMLIAAQISAEAIAILTIVYSLMLTLITPASGLNQGLLISIGNALGAGNAKLAKASIVSGFGVLFCLQCLSVMILVLGGKSLWRLWSHDEAILAYAPTITPFVVVCHLTDGWQYCLQALCRGTGKQAQAAKMVMVSMWLIGLPTAAWLVFIHHWGIYGVLCGLMVGGLVEVPCLLYAASGWDWEKLTTIASKKSIQPQVVDHREADALDEVPEAEEKDVANAADDSSDAKPDDPPDGDSKVSKN